MIDFVRFPHTPHLAWLGRGEPRRDKVLTNAELERSWSSDVVVEEKIDGAKPWLSVDDHDRLRAPKPRQHLDLDGLTGQWKPLARWLSTRQYHPDRGACAQPVLFESGATRS